MNILWLFGLLFFFVVLLLAELSRKLIISENASVRSTVGYISGSGSGSHDHKHDQNIADDFDNRRPNYTLIFPPEHFIDQTFYVNPFTGLIKLKKMLDYESTKVYIFLAIPTDSN